MEKKIVALLVAALLLAGAAFAETASFTDRGKDFTFEYDADQFEITLEDYADDTDDDADLVLVLTGKNAAWGDTEIEFLKLDTEDEPYTLDQFAELEEALDTTVEQGEWNGFKDVFQYAYEVEDVIGQTFIISYDDDESLTISVTVTAMNDEDAQQLRDDAISAVLDSLKIIDD